MYKDFLNLKPLIKLVPEKLEIINGYDYYKMKGEKYSNNIMNKTTAEKNMINMFTEGKLKIEKGSETIFPIVILGFKDA